MEGEVCDCPYIPGYSFHDLRVVSKNIPSPEQTTSMTAFTPTEVEIGSKAKSLPGQMSAVVNTKLWMLFGPCGKPCCDEKDQISLLTSLREEIVDS